MLHDELEYMRIMIVDDKKRDRDGLRTLIESAMSDAVIVGEAESGKEAVALAHELEQLDIILMDIEMPNENGIDATRRIHIERPHIKIIMVTQYGDDDAMILAALKAGARGYVLKTGPKTDVVRAIRAIYHGDAMFSPGVAHRLIKIFTAHPYTSLSDVFPELSARELEVLELMAQRLSDEEIKERMGITVRGVQRHRDNIYSKLDVHSKLNLLREVDNRTSTAKICPWCGNKLP